MKVAVLGAGAIGAYVGAALHRAGTDVHLIARGPHLACGPLIAPLLHDTTAYCGVGCNLTLHVQDNEIVKVTSPHDNPVTHGNLCIKGRFGFQHVQNRV